MRYISYRERKFLRDVHRRFDPCPGDIISNVAHDEPFCPETRERWPLFSVRWGRGGGRGEREEKLRDTVEAHEAVFALLFPHNDSTPSTLHPPICCFRPALQFPRVRIDQKAESVTLSDS